MTVPGDKKIVVGKRRRKQTTTASPLPTAALPAAGAAALAPSAASSASSGGAVGEAERQRQQRATRLRQQQQQQQRQSGHSAAVKQSRRSSSSRRREDDDSAEHALYALIFGKVLASSTVLTDEVSLGAVLTPWNLHGWSPGFQRSVRKKTASHVVFEFRRVLNPVCVPCGAGACAAAAAPAGQRVGAALLQQHARQLAHNLLAALRSERSDHSPHSGHVRVNLWRLRARCVAASCRFGREVLRYRAGVSVEAAAATAAERRRCTRRRWRSGDKGQYRAEADSRRRR